MKGNEGKTGRIISFLLAAGLLLGCYFVGLRYVVYNLSSEDVETVETKHNVTLVPKGTTAAFWQLVFTGANTAATEYNLNLTISGPDNEEDYEGQNQLIREAVEEGAEAIVLSAIDYERNAQAVDEAAAAGVKIVVIDSDVNSEAPSCRISTDNYEAGRQVFEAMRALTDEELKVGTVNFYEDTANGQEREEGFLDALEADGNAELIAQETALSTTEDSMEAVIEMFEEHPEINAVTAFNEWTSLGVGYAVRELGIADETTVVVFDSNSVSAGMLEQGEIDALIVQSTYAMGYLGVECAYNLINGKEPESEKVDTATYIITKDNMYDEESQKVMFVFD